MADLPTVNAVDELKEQVTLDRQALQKSLRAGLLNVVKSINSLHDSFNAAFDVQKRMLDAQEAAALAMREKELEDARKKKDKVGDSAIAAITKDIGYSGLLLATAIGTVGGLIQGQIAAIRNSFKIIGNVFKGIGNLLKPITKPIANLAKNIVENSKRLTAAFSKISESFSKMKNFATGIINGIKNFDVKAAFKSIGQGISSAIKGLKTTFITNSLFGAAFEKIQKVFKPFTDLMQGAFKTIKGLVSGPAKVLSGVFSTIQASLATFGGVVSKVAAVVGKIFAPIAIVLAAFDSIRGAIAGYAESGFLGGIQGAIEGLFNSLINKPLDFIKGILSKVLDFFGAESIAEALDSFSFEKIFNDIMDAIFGGIRNLGKGIKDGFLSLFGGSGDDDIKKEIKKETEVVETPEPEPLPVATQTDSFDDSGFVSAEEGGVGKQRLPEEPVKTKEEIKKERQEALQKNLAALSAKEAEQKKKIAESEAKIRALGYDDPMSLGRIEIGDEKAEAAADEQMRLMAAKQKLKNISGEKTMSQNQLDFLNDNPLRRRQAQNNVNSNVNNVTTNNTSAVNKTTAMPASAGRQGGAQYKTAAGFG